MEAFLFVVDIAVMVALVIWSVRQEPRRSGVLMGRRKPGNKASSTRPGR